MRLRLLVIVALIAELVGGQSTPVRASARWSPWASFFATGYDETGATASGVPAGWGVVAVDPRTIPLGSTVQVRGLGSFRALDTGGAIVGRRIDIWRPTAAQCYALTGWYRVRWRV